MNVRVLATGLGWPEGPCLLPEDAIAFVEMYRSQVSVFRPGRGVAQLAWTGGGPNAAILGSDGCLYVTQNGGVDGPWQAEVRMPPSIQRIDEAGKVEVLLTEVDGHALRAPNDLAFGPDGRLYFTDPGQYEPESPSIPGRVLAIDSAGVGEVIAELPPVYPNGILVRPDGTVIWTESYTRTVRCRTADGPIVELCRWSDPSHVPDGLKADNEGNLYVTTTASAGIHVLHPDGTAAQFLAAGDVPTNCVFRGSELIVTGGGHTGTAVAALTGSLFALDLDVVGAPTFAGTLSNGGGL